MSDHAAIVRAALLAANEDVYGPDGNQDALAALARLAADAERLREKERTLVDRLANCRAARFAEAERLRETLRRWMAAVHVDDAGILHLQPEASQDWFTLWTDSHAALASPPAGTGECHGRCGEEYANFNCPRCRAASPPADTEQPR